MDQRQIYNISCRDAVNRCFSSGKPVFARCDDKTVVMMSAAEYEKLMERLALTEIDALLEQGLADDQDDLVISLSNAAASFKNGIRNV